MKKNLIILIQLFSITLTLFAKQTFDDAIQNACTDIRKKCDRESILLIEEIRAPSQAMTSYIEEKLLDHMFKEQNCFQIVNRKEMDKFDRELMFQHNSGMVSVETIVPIAKRYGANTIIIGDFEEQNNGYRLIIKIFDIETSTYIFLKDYNNISRSSEIEQLLGRKASYKKVGLGYGVEINKNSFEFIAPAALISFDYNIFRKIALGTKIHISYDIKENINKPLILETLALFRVYLVSFSGEPGTGIFIEGLGGLSTIFLEGSDTKFSQNFGGGFGYRFGFKNVFIEHEIRTGYPYMFGVNLSFGFRF